ncbi:MAG: type I-E CRISPR-associated protein Cas7/Cse4/CasC [Candidatus Sumerlaea chitinivorans]|jgi:CRISPR system Cascade subunit CasC|nr:type I-E CRISPR-associated protein Cas7/Cse4/CasC [Candidatus Sumerlaea chitinivorans]
MNTPRFITIHMIQNHAPSNLNRDDLGAPKTAYFGGKLRLRISSQCLKRSIRRSELFKELCGGIRTRRMLQLYGTIEDDGNLRKKALTVLNSFAMFQGGKSEHRNADSGEKEDEEQTPEASASAHASLAIYVPVSFLQSIREMVRKERDELKRDRDTKLTILAQSCDANLLSKLLIDRFEADKLKQLVTEYAPQKKKKGTDNEDKQRGKKKEDFAKTLAESIAKSTEKAKLFFDKEISREEEITDYLEHMLIKKDIIECLQQSDSTPDIALFGRMLESGDKILNTRVEAAAQVAHAISTHEITPEVDYFIAADDIPGEDAGAAYLDEAGFGSACYYKFFCVDWPQLCENLAYNKRLAAHTVAAFLRAAALTTPTGKQNSFAAFNPPDAIMLEFRDLPLSYANAFVRPVEPGERDLVAESIAQLLTYVQSIDRVYRSLAEDNRFVCVLGEDSVDIPIPARRVSSLDEMIEKLCERLGMKWEEVRKEVLNEADRLESLLSEYREKKNQQAPSSNPDTN